MSVQARFSAKGQIVIPKDVRDRYRFRNGEVVDVIETPQGVLLARAGDADRITFDEALSRIRSLVRYDGPPLSVEQLSWSPDVADDPAGA